MDIKKEELSKKEYLQFSQDIILTVNDMDFCERLKPSSILSYFQDIATEHANHLSIGFELMVKENLAWVMSRSCFKVFRHPRIGESLTLKTFPEQPKAVDVARGYYIFDKNGEIVVSGSSRWCVLDVTTRKIQRCDKRFEDKGYLYIPFSPLENANSAVGTIVENGEFIGNYKVQLTDLDRNKHMNNSRYADILFNACEKDFIEKHTVERFDINFLCELFYGDTISIYRKVNDKSICVEAVKGERAVFRAIASFV